MKAPGIGCLLTSSNGFSNGGALLGWQGDPKQIGTRKEATSTPDGDRNSQTDLSTLRFVASALLYSNGAHSDHAFTLLT
jgi:hypothetical protein